MKHTYQISGIHCNSCVSKIRSELLKIGDIVEAEVRETSPQATITMQRHIPLNELQSAISKGGDYHISVVNDSMETTAEDRGWFQTYKPVLLLGFYLVVFSVLLSVTSTGFDWTNAMRVFMGGFFISFSFFKMLDLKGFAEAYSGYDIIARKVSAWGYVYAVLELLLGMAFATNFYPMITTVFTIVLMSVSLIGVVQAVLKKTTIRCACLGTVFNLPMSTVTIIEDTLMLVMSFIMLTSML